MTWFSRNRTNESAQAKPRDLRTRYVPRTRIRPFYLQAAPWLDLLFILFFLVSAQSRIVLRPGVVVALPAFEGVGVQGGALAVLVPNSRAGRLHPTLFYSDESFRLEDMDRAQDLLQIWEKTVASDPSGTLTLYADARVPQSYVIQVMDIASRAGFSQLNIGTAPGAISMP